MDAEAILAQIERVVRWADAFRLAFVKCNYPCQQEVMRRALLDCLKKKRIFEVFLEKPVISLLDEVSSKEPQQALASWVAAYRIAKEIDWAKALQNLDNLAKQVGGPGLQYWETLARQLPAGEDDG